MTQAALSIVAAELPVATGVKKSDRKSLADLLGDALASSYVLYHKIHAYHWNVSGPFFYSLHKLTDAQYRDVAEAIDAIAERIRSIGFAAPVGLSRYVERSVVSDVVEIKTAGEMVAELSQDHQKVAKQMRETVKAADDADDVYTADLLTSRIGAHEEAAWMLNAILVDGAMRK